jgi:hypothetical protein
MKGALIRISIVVAVAVVVLVVLRHLGLNNNQRMMENMANSERENMTVENRQNDMQVGMDATAGSGTTQTENTLEGMNQQPQELVGGSVQSMYSASTEPGVQNMRSQNCFPKEQLTPAELLPQDNSSAWAQVNPTGSGTLKDRNFLQSGHHIGINTVGQTLRNANLQLRSEPPNPQVKVSPWIQSTIDPDTNRKPMEIGGCA